MDEILPIKPPPLPFSPNDKIFNSHDEEGNPIGEPYSYNDWIKTIEDLSGVNPEFFGD